MKRFIALTAALSVAPLLPVHAQQGQATPATVAPAPAADAVDPAIKALFEKSAQAYKALNDVSMHVVITRKSGETTTTTNSDVSWSGEDKARVEVVTDKGRTVHIADGAKFSEDVDATTYRSDDAKGIVGRIRSLQRLQSAANLPLPYILTGTNFLEVLPKWESAKVLPDGSVQLVALLGKEPNAANYTFNIAIDPADNLMRRVELTTTVKDKVTVYTTTFSDVKTAPQFTPTTFTYTPAAGAKLYVEPPMYDPKLVVGATPFELKGKDMEGKTHSWNEYKGKVVLLDFWATWCGPCIGELPNVLKNYETYHPQGFEIIGVSLDDDKKALTDFIKARDLKYVNLFDGQGWKNVDGQTYGVQAIPFTLLIGKDGKIAAVNPRGEKLEPALKEALAKN